MRKPAEVLELALATLDEHTDSCYMCCHLDWLHVQEYISEQECLDTRRVVRKSIDFRTTLRGYLADKGIVPRGVFSQDAKYRPYMVEFYTNLIATLKQE